MDFNIGQKVVCIKGGEVLRTNAVYTVQGIKTCPSCKLNMIDVGYSVYDHNALQEICLCGIEISKSIKWYANFLFRSLEYNIIHEEILEKFKSPKESPDVPIKEPQTAK